MIKIKILDKVGGHEVGTELELSEGAADYLVENGYAEPSEPKQRRTKTAQETQSSS